MIDDDGSLSGEILAVETPDSQGHKQALWVQVTRPFYGNEQAKDPVVWVSYQQEHEHMGGSPLLGPVMLDPATWRALTRAVEWRLRRHEPWWRQLLRRMSQ